MENPRKPMENPRKPMENPRKTQGILRAFVGFPKGFPRAFLEFCEGSVGFLGFSNPVDPQKPKLQQVFLGGSCGFLGVFSCFSQAPDTLPLKT